MNATHKNSMDNAYKTARDAADTAAQTARDGAKAVVRGVEDFSTAAKRKVEDVSDAVNDKAHEIAHDVADAAGAEKNGVSKVLQSAQEAARSTKDALLTGAGSTFGTVRDVAMEKADEARETLSDVGDRIAATLERASTKDGGDAMKSRILSTVAQGLTQASASLRERSVVDLTDDLKTLARRHPGAFMAGAAVVGFAAARFVRSSARRRLAHYRDDRGSQS